MADGVVYIITITLLIALGGLAFWIAQQSFGGSGLKFFQNKMKRTGVIEATAMDGRRRLVLVRRDNVEHLIMTGGPVDVVIETGIKVGPEHELGLGSFGRADGMDVQRLDGEHPSYVSEGDSVTLRNEPQPN